MSMTTEQRRTIAGDAGFFLREARILLNTIGEESLAGLVDATEQFVSMRENELAEQAEMEFTVTAQSII